MASVHPGASFLVLVFYRWAILIERYLHIPDNLFEHRCRDTCSIYFKSWSITESHRGAKADKMGDITVLYLVKRETEATI